MVRKFKIFNDKMKSAKLQAQIMLTCVTFFPNMNRMHFMCILIGGGDCGHISQGVVAIIWWYTLLCKGVSVIRLL